MNVSKTKVKTLEKISFRARQLMAQVFIQAGCGHPGGSFSSIDMLIALYFEIMRINSKKPQWQARDRFILSKGHSSAALYTTLHLKGFLDAKTLLSFRQNDSILSGHPDKTKVPGVEMSTGSLGHGLSVGIGAALAGKMDKKKHRVFVLMGDGETQEGTVWEGAMSASHFALDNLTAIVDRNRIQIDGFTEDIMSLEPYADKWRSFGWEVREINGHDFCQILEVFKKLPFKKGKPSLIISKTVKGKGISFMENNPEWHGKALKGKFAEQALKELRCDKSD